MGPWSTHQANRARGVPASGRLNFLGADYKRDTEYEALDPSRKSIRLQVSSQGRDFHFILASKKRLNELLLSDQPNGGAIDFVRHFSGQGGAHAH